MNWRRRARPFAVCPLFGILAFGGCASQDRSADRAAGTDSSVAAHGQEASVGPGSQPIKPICTKIKGAVDSVRTIDSTGGRILVTAADTDNVDRNVALLRVPADAVSAPTKFTVRVPGGPHVVAYVTAKQGASTITSFAKDLQLTLYYDRGCSVPGPNGSLTKLTGFRTVKSPSNEEEPDADSPVPGTNDQTGSVELSLDHLSGYILAQGLVGLGPDTTSSDTASNPTQ